MKLRFFGSVVLGFALALTLTACGSDGGSNTPPGHVVTQKPYPAGFDPSQCGHYCPESGNTALYANLGVEKPVTSDLFGKRYNRATLEAVLDASIVETQKYAQQDGIYLFKIPSPAGDRRFPLQYLLDEPPSELRSIWDKVSSGNSENSYLDGLFVGSGARRAIMVREDAGRWTLVHEMMHANFARQRMLDQVPSAAGLKGQIQNTLSQVDSLLNEYQKTSEQKNLSDAADLAATLPDLENLALGQGSLEEVAVESLLGEEYRAKRLKFVNPEALYSSKFYIESNINQALPEIQQTSATLSALKDKVFAAGLPDSATELATAMQSCEDLKSRLAELLAVAKKTSDDAQNPTASSFPLAAAASFRVVPQLDEDAVRKAAEQNARAAANTPAQRALHEALDKLSAKLKN